MTMKEQTRREIKSKGHSKVKKWEFINYDDKNIDYLYTSKIDKNKVKCMNKVNSEEEKLDKKKEELELTYIFENTNYLRSTDSQQVLVKSNINNKLKSQEKWYFGPQSNKRWLITEHKKHNHNNLVEKEPDLPSFVFSPTEIMKELNNSELMLYNYNVNNNNISKRFSFDVEFDLEVEDDWDAIKNNNTMESASLLSSNLIFKYFLIPSPRLNSLITKDKAKELFDKITNPTIILTQPATLVIHLLLYSMIYAVICFLNLSHPILLYKVKINQMLNNIMNVKLSLEGLKLFNIVKLILTTSGF
ncbi:hypothetical protein K502DRAFT_365114 [Neoconidiobolus thromboides FSU 785]|nr:hypothetical protein K502DRAFT_365114 [Neoconidiobolus thromboides FSU 785]